MERSDLRPSVAAGLSSAAAAQRLAEDGPNLLPGPRRPSAARRLLGEFLHFFALMLWAASVLAYIGGMPQLAVAIVVVIVVNGLFAFFQQQRAEHAAEQLGRLLPSAVRVRRDGADTVLDAAAVVRDDVLVLQAGDRLPADAEVLVAVGCRVDESMLTGESVPRAVGAGDGLFGGTFVTGGEATARVTATGTRTRLAEITELTVSTRRPKSPLTREIERVVRTVAIMAVGVGVAFFALSLLVGSSARDGFLFAVGVTVALVPEGLLPTVTLSLAIGAQRMAGHQALVRNLESVQTLGSTTFICTDKTGTLTRNEMSVVAAWTAAGAVRVTGEGYAPTGRLTGPDDVTPAAGPLLGAVQRLARTARGCSGGRIVAVTPDGHGEGATTWRPTGDPMEAAIDAFARRAGVDAAALDADDGSIRARFPFDPSRRRESVRNGVGLLVKGAPEAVLPRCTRGPLAEAPRELDALASEGLRVLAVAWRPTGDPAEPGTAARVSATVPAGTIDETADDVETDLELLGLLAFEDPPRPEVPDALRACRRAGVKVAMLTGDHPVTARAIGLRIGLLDGEGLVLEGSALPEDPAVLGALLDRDGVVISRVSPEDKLRITRALQQRGHVVAMTGDGVNDGPALQEADIGVAMGRSGTDVAREASDLVLLDDNFATIVQALESGRSTFANIRRFLTYHLTDNVAELTPFVVWALSGGRFPLALSVLAVLCLDIGTDLLPALALGAEPPGERVLDGPPPRRHLIDANLLRRAFGVLGPTEAAMEMLVFVAVLALAGWRPGAAFPTGTALAQASGAAFAAVVLGQVANAFACRSSSLPAWRVRDRRNRLLSWAVAVELVLLGCFLAVGPVARQLGHAMPTVAGLAMAALTAPAVLATDALHKRLRHRRR